MLRWCRACSRSTAGLSRIHDHDCEHGHTSARDHLLWLRQKDGFESRSITLATRDLTQPAWLHRTSSLRHKTDDRSRGLRKRQVSASAGMLTCIGVCMSME